MLGGGGLDWSHCCGQREEGSSQRAATMNLGQQTAAARQLKCAVIAERPRWGLGPLLLFPHWPHAACSQQDAARWGCLPLLQPMSREVRAQQWV